MIAKDKSYRFRLPQQLFVLAEAKAESEDIRLAQVLRRLLSGWVNGEIELPAYHSPEDRDDE